MSYVPFGTPPDPATAQRVFELEDENARLRRLVKRYKRGNLAIFVLLVVLPFGLFVAQVLTSS